MRSTQNNSPVLAQQNQRGEVSTILQGQVDALCRSLQARVNSLNKKRRSLDDRVHWVTRGRQQALRRVSAHLWAIEAASLSSYTLYLMLQEYLACLNKWGIDAEEERQARGPQNGFPLEQWKAEGEARELPRMVRLLSRIVQEHTPDFVRHTLSLDGKHLVSLCLGSDEPGRDPAISVQSLQMLEESRLLADPHKASEQGQERALLPIRRRTFVPALGPFPILPDEISAPQQALLLKLEETLAHHARVLINTKRERVDIVGLLLMFLDRVLQYTPVGRILVLAGSTHLLARSCQRYRTWVSLEDGVPLSERYAAQYKPTIPLVSDTQICFSSVREMQLVICSSREPDAVLCRQSFDLIVVCDARSLTIPWQQILGYFDASYLVGFGSPSEPLVAGLFDHVITTSDTNFQDDECADRCSASCRKVMVNGQAHLKR
ncbi:MAG TPA: hypothetical protein VFV38_10625 [Ktedonobacteraceae bacterium]|nr:hypothetical protein [Ktedonobacteraceae bacterium]